MQHKRQILFTLVLFAIAGVSFLLWSVRTEDNSAESSRAVSTLRPDATNDVTDLEGYRTITAETLHEWMPEKDFFLVDVHVPEQQHIPGTDAVIPYNAIVGDASLPEDKDTKIVLYCRSGSMSREAAAALVAEGYTDVYHLEGGIRAYNAY